MHEFEFARIWNSHMVSLYGAANSAVIHATEVRDMAHDSLAPAVDSFSDRANALNELHATMREAEAEIRDAIEILCVMLGAVRVEQELKQAHT